ncbi:hypothetical protein ANN_11822 [Periplaneta americana]|uniref:Uncharacterized protein n=1 Tax=Periplaneta americana TaxID=6978 RepID=A0ABQ8T649_PERAM|nr:hypothetical protein ANN_11822 [Periplaneta americana]
MGTCCGVPVAENVTPTQSILNRTSKILGEGLDESDTTAEEAGTAEFVQSEPAAVSLISVSSGRSVSSSGANSSSTNTLWSYGQLAEPLIRRFYFFKYFLHVFFRPFGLLRLPLEKLNHLKTHYDLFNCETWTLTLREEHRLRMYENKVLRKIFGAKRDEVTGEWRKLHNTELHALYSSPDIIRNIKSGRLRWAGHVAHMGESRNSYRVLVGRLEGKRPLGRPRRRWEDNIKMDFREVGYDNRDWVNLAQDRDQWRAYVRAAMNLREVLPLSAEVATDAHRLGTVPKDTLRNTKCSIYPLPQSVDKRLTTEVLPLSAEVATDAHRLGTVPKDTLQKYEVREVLPLSAEVATDAHRLGTVPKDTLQKYEVREVLPLSAEVATDAHRLGTVPKDTLQKYEVQYLPFAAVSGQKTDNCD